LSTWHPSIFEKKGSPDKKKGSPDKKKGKINYLFRVRVS
jgi:hypothetical protein